MKKEKFVTKRNIDLQGLKLNEQKDKERVELKQQAQKLKQQSKVNSMEVDSVPQ